MAPIPDNEECVNVDEADAQLKELLRQIQLSAPYSEPRDFEICYESAPNTDHKKDTSLISRHIEDEENDRIFEAY